MVNQLNVTSITPPRVPIIDERTGLISREWYRFFLNLFILTGSGTNYTSLTDLQVVPPIEQQSAEIAEMWKYINALLIQPRSELGTMSQLQQSWLPWITFATAHNSAPPDIGTLSWDGGTTLGIQMTSEVLGRINESGYYYIKASDAIAKGQVVMFTGSVGSSGVPTGAPATGVTDGSYIMGVAAEDLPVNEFGLVQFIGSLRGIDTSSYNEGDVLWYDPTIEGGVTDTKPTAPNVKVQIAAVVSSSNNGTILIRVSSGSELGGTDSNVQLGNLQNKDVLRYNGMYWENVTSASFIAEASGSPVVKTSNFTVGDGETWIINNKIGGSCVVTLPSSGVGRVLHFLNHQPQALISSSNNVVPLIGGAANTAILGAVTGAHATLVYDGVSWVTMQYSS